MASATRDRDDDKPVAGGDVGGPAGATGQSDPKTFGSGKGKIKARKQDDTARADDVDDDDIDSPQTDARVKAAAGPRRSAGYFTILKKGQGYWTRMGTAIGAVVLGVMLAYTIYDKIPPYFIQDPGLGRKVAVGSAVGFLVAYTIFAWSMMNKPTNVEFLIQTDSEMKKVNWTSRKDLIGSTKVVIIFMLLIACFLFFVDFIFATLMRLIHVLKVTPWGG